MAKIVPSDIVKFIDKIFPNAEEFQKEGRRFSITPYHAGSLEALLDMLDKIEDILLQLRSDDLSCFIASKFEIKSKLKNWQSGHDMRSLEKTPGYDKESPVILIRRLLESCPDRFIPPKVAGLKFIKDKKYRKLLRADLASLEFLFNNNEWKATMVIAGSAIEAILCEQISNIEKTDKNKFAAAKKAVCSRGDISIFPNDITRWNLSQYIYIAHELNLISDETKKQALLGANFRNLIHPGRAIRKKESCDRGTSLSVYAALERVIKDIRGQ